MADPAADTVVLVPVGLLTGLARVAADLLKAEDHLFEARRRMPHVTPEAEYRAARAAEKRVDEMTRDALHRDRVALPGMEGGDPP